MEKVIEKIKTDRIKEINAKEAIDLLDKWRVQSVKSNAKDNENENAFEAKTDPFHPQNFSTWLSKQTGKKYDTLHSIASILTTFAVLELANNFLELGMDRRFERSNIHILDVLTLLIAGGHSYSFGIFFSIPPANQRIFLTPPELGLNVKRQ